MIWIRAVRTRSSPSPDQRTQIGRYNRSAVSTQEYRISISESRSGSVAQLIVSDQHRGIVNRRPAIKMHPQLATTFIPPATLAAISSSGW